MQGFINIHEASKLLRVSPRFLYEEVRRGNVPFIRIGRLLRFDPQEVLDYYKHSSQQGSEIKGKVKWQTN
ncbi:TPA: DNA-binding protein [Candidatus Bathyarchaeota archaeon]|nr:DNA-binding protein [Candidatus Bathyarchaeota archaeon]